MSRGRVLIADDDEICVFTVQEMLSDKYDTDYAHSGEETLAKVEEFKPNLLLLDYNMPDMDGFGVLTELNRRGKNLPVIFVTGQAESDIETAGLKLGAVDYLTKPVNEAILLARVNNQLEMANYRDRLEKIVDQRTRAVRETLNAVVIGMALLAEVNDPHTGAHINRVRTYCQIICDKMQGLRMYPEISSTEYTLISVLSPVHDIGKVGIPDDVLLKPGRLTPEEFEIMANHTVFGEKTLDQTRDFLRASDREMLADMEAINVGEFHHVNARAAAAQGSEWLEYRDMFLRLATEIAVGHHERWDGTGYPYKLAGEKIPLSARVVSLADIYDALTSVRPYKKAFSHEETMNIILKGDGRTMPHHFDPNVLQAVAACSDDLSRAALELRS